MKNPLFVVLPIVLSILFSACGVPPRPTLSDSGRKPINKSAPNPDSLPGAKQAKKWEDKQRQEEEERAAAAVKAPEKSVVSSTSIADIPPQEQSVSSPAKE